MNNLKRVLSVGMASTMVLGMMATASAASFNDFTDKDEIVNKEAVSMVTELGIIAGLPDGSYGATQNIDRASFARLVCVALNGGKEPNLGNLKTTFTDTQGHWAEKYIAYCVQQGIIAGKGNNTFAPADNVTGSEAAKMLLVALGYNTTYEGIGGATWQVTTDVLANQAGLYEDLEGMNTSAPLTRDQAAQMIYNTLNATMVKYEMVPGISTNGQVTMTTQRVNVTKTVDGTTSNVTLLSDAFGAISVDGVIVANESGSALDTNTMDKGYTKVQTGVDKDGKAVYTTLKVSTDADMLGKSVTAYAKDLEKGVYKTVYGSPVLSDDCSVAELTKSYSESKLTSALKDEGIKSVNGATVVYNGLKSDTTYSSIKALADDTGNGIEINVINNSANDSSADYIVISKQAVGKVAAYNEKGNDGDGYITVNAISANGVANIAGAEFADVVGSENIAKDDIVLYSKVNDTWYVEKAESVNVTPSSSTDNDTVTADGKDYKASALNVDYAKETEDKTFVDGVTLGEEATFYLDSCGYVVYVDAVAASDDYMYVTGAKVSSDKGFESITVKGVLADNTEVTWNVSKYNGKSVSKMSADEITKAGNVLNGKGEDGSSSNGIVVVSYSKNGDSYNISTNKANATPTKINKGNPALGGNVVANDKTVFVYVNKDNGHSVYTGIANAPTVKSDSGAKFAAVVGSDGKTAKFVVVTGAQTSGSGKDIYVVSDSVSVKKDGDDTVYTIKAIVDGEYNEALVVNADSKPTVVEGFYANVDMDSDGSVAASELQSGGVSGAKVTAFGDGVITAGDDTLSYNDKTKVIIIDGSKVNTGDISEIIYIKDDAANSSTVVLVAGEDDNAGIAEYIYVIR